MPILTHSSLLMKFSLLHKASRLVLTLVFSLMVAISPGWAQATFTYVGTVGSWTNPSSWTVSGSATSATYPGQACTGSQVHNVVIGSLGIVSLNTSITALVNDISVAGSLSIGGGYTLAATGAVSGSGGVTVGAGSSFNVAGNLTLGTLSFSGVGNTRVGGNFDVTTLSTNLLTGGANVTFNGSSTQTIARGNTFQLLTLANTGGPVVLSAAITATTTSIPANNELRLATFTGSNLGTVSGAGMISITAANGGTAGWPSGTYAGFLMPGGGTVKYYGTGVSYSIGTAPPLPYNAVIFTGLGKRTLTTPIDIEGGLTIDAQDTLALSGVTVELGEGDFTCNGYFQGGSNSTFRLTSEATNQTISGSGVIAFSDMTLDKLGKNVLLGMPIRINGNLNLNDAGYLVQNSYDITLAPDSRIRGNYPFGNDCMIKQDGTSGPGALVKEAITASQFVQCGTPTPLDFVFPIGTGSLYTPAQINVLSATVTGTATISIKAIPFSSAATNILKRNWRVLTNNISAITDAQIQFTFDGSEVNGTPNYVIRTQSGTVYGATSGYVSGVTGTQTFGVNAAGNTYLEETWGLSRANQLPRTYYSFASGSWDSPSTWTTDPTGSAQVNMPASGGPNNNDVAVILRGHTVTMPTGSKSLNSLIINEGGTLDAGGLTTLAFGLVSGQGTLRLSNLALPTGVYTDFVATDGGTIDYYNVTGSIPGSQLTYCNLKFSGTGTKTIATAGANRTYVLNGGLTVAGGNVVIGNETNRVWMSIAGNVTVAAGCSLTTAAPLAQHNLDISGSLINNGVARFTNRTAPVTTAHQTNAPTDGYVRIRFLGGADQVATCNGPTDFYSIEVQKGIDPTYKLTLSTADTTYCNFLGQVNIADSGSANDINTRSYQAINTRYGTLVLGSKVKVNALTTYQWRVNAGAGLILDGARVNLYNTGGGGGSALLLYGRFTLKNGWMDCGVSEGIVTRGAGEYYQSGGYIRAIRFRPSTIASTTPRGVFDMSGGQMDIVGGNNPGQSQYGSFCWPYPANVFRMSGGTINVYGANPSSGANNAFLIGCDPGNISVSGGTVNFNIPSGGTAGTNDFGVTSTTPLYNVNINSSQPNTTGLSLKLMALQYNPGSGAITVPARDLIVLNNLTVGANAWLNCNSTAGVQVGGNLTFASGSRYSAGTTTLTMGGTTPGLTSQTAALNQATTFNNLTINNTFTNGRVTFSGVNPSVTGNFNIQAGTMDDGGLTFSCSGPALNNSGKHLGTGRIKAVGYASAVQTFGGSGNGIWGNVEFASSVPASYSFKLMADQTIDKACILTDGLVDLSTFNLRYTKNASLSIGTGGQTTTRTFSTTSGLATDGGVSMEFSSVSGTFSFPMAYGGALRPLQVSTTASTYGWVNVIPVNGRHPNANTGTGTDALKFYWKVGTSGFANLTASTLRFDYVNADCSPSGAATDDNTYVVGRYNPGSFSWTTSTYSTQNSNYFSYSFSIPAGSTIDGEYTAGKIGAFGGVVVYESIRSGNWGTANTWKRTQGGTDLENPSTSVPTSTAPVLIHANHVVTVTAASGALSVASLRIDTLGTLDLGVTNASGNIHNFGTVLAGVPASGTLKLSSAAAAGVFPDGNFTDFFDSQTGGTVHYYRNATNFAIPTTSPSGGALNAYRHLIVAPTGGTITLPSLTTNVWGDMTILGPSGTVNMSVSLGDFIIGNKLSIQTGTTLAPGTTGSARTWTVGGNIVNAGTFAPAVGGSLVHNLYVTGSILNSGTLNFEPGTSAQTVVATTFQGSADQQVSGAGATTKFNRIILNKGTTSVPVLDVSATNFSLGGDGSLAAASKPLVLQNGTFKLTTNRTVTVSSGASAEMFQIPATAALWVTTGKVLLTGTGSNAGLQLDGTLKLTGTGVVRLDCGSTASADNSIQYASVGTPTIDMAGDSLRVGGQIRGNAVSVSGSLTYSQSRGDVYIGYRNAATSIKGMFEVVNQGNLLLSGGRIFLARSQGNASVADVLLQPAGYTVTGGELLLGGNGYTPASTVFSINATAPLYALTLNTGSTASNHAKVSLYTNPLQVLGTCTFNTSTVFTANNLDLKLGGNWVNNGSYTPGTNTTWFNGAAGDQTLSGSSATSLFDATVANTSATGNVTLAGTDWLVSQDLTLSNGTLAANSRNIVVKRNVSNSATHTSTTGVLMLNGTQTQRISGSGSGAFGSVTIDNALSVQADDGFTINGTLRLTNGLLDMQAEPLTLGTASGFAGTFSATRMIRTSGNSGDGGIRRLVDAGAFNFTLPIGVDNLYTPVSYNASANTASGSITVRPVSNVHPLVAMGGAQALDYYWSVSSTGLGGLSLTHTYTYDQSSATGRGNENNYIGARLTSVPNWVTYTGTVSNAANTITLPNLNIAAGDYTAGEAAMFAPITPFISLKSGPWTDPSTWQVGSVPTAGSVVQIVAGHTVIQATNGLNLSRIQLSGTLDLGTTTGHNLGTITGTGTLALATNNLPAGSYTTFTAIGGGTIQFNGAGHALPASRTVYNNLTINSSGTITNVDAGLTINGNFTIAAGTFQNQTNRKVTVRQNFINNGTYVAGTAASNENLELYFDFTNNGTFVPGNTNVLFRGYSYQRINGTSQTTFSRMQINKSSGTVGGETSLTVTDLLTLNSGRLLLVTANLTLEATCAIKPDVLTSASYVWANQPGFMIRKIASVPMQNSTNYTLFPVGDDTRYLPFNFRLKQGTLAPNAQIAINVRNYAHPQRRVAARYLNIYWQVVPTGISGDVNYDAKYWITNRNEITRYYDLDARPIVPSKYSGGAWTTGDSYDSTQLAFTWNNITSFSDYTGGTGMGEGAISLPVTMGSLAAKVEDKGIALNWDTETEIDNAGFWVQRSADGRTWEAVTWLKAQGSGNSLRRQNYDYLDGAPHPGRNFYRICQQDRNGKKVYSNTVSAVWQVDAYQPEVLVVPNPGASHEVHLYLKGFNRGTARITVTDSKGTPMVVKEVEVAGPSSTSVPVAPPQGLPPGLYNAILEMDEQRLLRRFVIQ